MLSDITVSNLIIKSYYEKLLSALENDVVIVGAGPSGLIAAYYLAKEGYQVSVIEKRLAPGGGIWGGGMAMNEVVVQSDAIDILDELDIRYVKKSDSLYTVDSVELASSLIRAAVRGNAKIFNLITFEDVAVKEGKVSGIVVNRTMISGNLHVDPITLYAKAVVDATGHDAVVVRSLIDRGLLARKGCEGPMNAEEGERFVVEEVKEVYPGLWVCGMSVCAVLGGPRMGPIFGGMLLSGKRVAELIKGIL